MPEIPDEIIKSVVILLSAYEQPIGTAFVAKHTILDEDFFDAFYLISCEHCVKDQVKARFSNGKTIEIRSAEWRKPASRDDIVAFEITDCVTQSKGQIGSINTGSIVKHQERFFGVGADIYMLGLLIDDHDIGQNLPRARFGNLSAFADERVLMEQGNGVKRPCHLGDMRSRTGFSGSPVFGYIEIPGLSGHLNYENRLFGVHSAQHPERILAVSESGFKPLDIPSSMTRIVPAWEILKLIEEDELFLKNQYNRKKTGKGLLGNTGAV